MEYIVHSNVIKGHYNSIAHGSPPPSRGTVLSSRIVLALCKNEQIWRAYCVRKSAEVWWPQHTPPSLIIMTSFSQGSTEDKFLAKLFQHDYFAIFYTIEL